MGCGSYHPQLTHAQLRVIILLFRHLFNLYELIVDDLIEHDRYQAQKYQKFAKLQRKGYEIGVYYITSRRKSFT